MKKYLIFLALFIIIPVVHAHDCGEQLPEGYCNATLTLETDKDHYKNGETILIYNKLSNKDNDFIIDYWIEDDNNIIIKEIKETTNTNKKQFTPKLAENTTLIIKNNLTNIECINIINNTYNELKVFVEVEKDPNPDFNIKKLYTKRGNKIGIGNNLTATISAYTGNSANLSISSYIENVTEEKTTLIYNEFNNTEFNVTLEIPNDCNIMEGNYFFVAKSLNKELKNNITITNNCEYNTTSYDNDTEYTENYTDENIINLIETSTNKLVYESTSEKAKKTATYLGLGVLALIIFLTLTTNKGINKWFSQSGHRSKQ